LAEGGTFNVGSRALRVSYAGGDGNDVVLTDVMPLSITGNPTMNGGVAYCRFQLTTFVSGRQIRQDR
jgi:hypothetical protein